MKTVNCDACGVSFDLDDMYTYQFPTNDGYMSYDSLIDCEEGNSGRFLCPDCLMEHIDNGWSLEEYQ